MPKIIPRGAGAAQGMESDMLVLDYSVWALCLARHLFKDSWKPSCLEHDAAQGMEAHAQSTCLSSPLNSFIVKRGGSLLFSWPSWLALTPSTWSRPGARYRSLHAQVEYSFDLGWL